MERLPIALPNGRRSTFLIQPLTILLLSGTTPWYDRASLSTRMVMLCDLHPISPSGWGLSDKDKADPSGLWSSVPPWHQCRRNQHLLRGKTNRLGHSHHSVSTRELMRSIGPVLSYCNLPGEANARRCILLRVRHAWSWGLARTRALFLLRQAC